MNPLSILSSVIDAITPTSNPAASVIVGSVVTNSHLTGVITSAITFAAGLMGWGDAIHNVATIMGGVGLLAITIAHANIVGTTDANSMIAFGEALEDEAAQLNETPHATSVAVGS